MIERTPPAKPRRAAPKIDLTGVEWKLLLGAALASVFTAAWFAVVQPAATEPPSDALPEPVAMIAPETAPAARPAATVPTSPVGASPETPSTPRRVTTVAPPVRTTRANTTVAIAPRQRSFRVRTRSS